MDKQVVWFYVEPFTLHLNRDLGWHLLSPIVLVLVPVPVPVPDTASVITPWDRRLSTMGMIRLKSSHKHMAISFLSVKGKKFCERPIAVAISSWMKTYEMTTIMIVYVASWTSHNMSLSSVKLCITRVLCIDYATVTVEIRWAAIIFLPEIWL